MINMQKPNGLHRTLFSLTHCRDFPISAFLKFTVNFSLVMVRIDHFIELKELKKYWLLIATQDIRFALEIE